MSNLNPNLLKLNCDQLIKLIHEKDDVIAQQRHFLQKVRAMQERAEQDAQGCNVVIAILAQREGGELCITDEELATHNYNLQIKYDGKNALTRFVSHKNPSKGSKILVGRDCHGS